MRIQARIVAVAVGLLSIWSSAQAGSPTPVANIIRPAESTAEWQALSIRLQMAVINDHLNATLAAGTTCAEATEHLAKASSGIDVLAYLYQKSTALSAEVRSEGSKIVAISRNVVDIGRGVVQLRSNCRAS